MVRTALVTGATGMVGSYIVDRLAREGWSVRAIVRSPGRATSLDAVDVDQRRGDILDPSALMEAARGCDAIFHAAAAIGPRGAWEPYRLGNVVGTSNVVDTAARVGARLVHISSTAVYGGDTRWRHPPTDETVVLPEIPESDPYARSKLEAERAVLAAAAEGRLWATVIRPPPMYGCRDRQLIPRIAPILARGFFPLINGGRSVLTIVHAASVADGAVLAAATDRAHGRAYNITNDGDVTVAQFVRYAATGLGRRVRTPAIPAIMARLGMNAAAVGLVMSGRGHLRPNLVGVLHLLTRDNPFSSERARTELGWTPRISHADAIPEAFLHWKLHGSAKATR